MHRVFAIAAACAACLGQPAYAQTQAPAEQGASSPPASAAPEAPADPERLALAHKLFSAMRLRDKYDAMFTGAIRSLKVPDGAAPEVKQKMTRLFDSLSAEAHVIAPALEEVVAESYAREFDLHELQSMVDYYDSDQGKVRLEKDKRVENDLAPGLMRVMTKWIDAAEVDYCAKQPCTKQDYMVFQVIRSVYDQAGTAPK